MRPRIVQTFVKITLWAAVTFTVGVLLFIISFILYHGLPVLSFSFLFSSVRQMGKEGGIFPMIVSTIAIALLSVIIATPMGVGTAIFLCEYTQESRLTKLIRFGTDCLAGIPSIIFGLFGFIFFVIFLHLSWSILSGALTLACMMVPTIIRTSEEAIRSVPRSYREVTYALGGTKLQSIRYIVLPKALPGIVTGIILSVGRAVSETAALIFTAGMSVQIPTSIFSSGRTMAVHFYTLAREGISAQNAYGTAAVLILTILLINILSYSITNRFIKRYQ